MPADTPEAIQAGIMEPIDDGVRRQSVISTYETKISVTGKVEQVIEEGILATEEELHGPNALRRVSAPIPWSVYTVAFVELCERFSYYGTQVVCMWIWQPSQGR
jgi:hypothetical protein